MSEGIPKKTEKGLEEKIKKQLVEARRAYFEAKKFSLSVKMEKFIAELYFAEQGKPFDWVKMVQLLEKKRDNILDSQANGYPEQTNFERDTKWTYKYDLGPSNQKCFFIDCEQPITKLFAEKHQLWMLVLCNKHYQQVKDIVQLRGSALWLDNTV